MEEWKHRNPGREPSPRGGGRREGSIGSTVCIFSLINQLISTVRRQHKTDSRNTNKKKKVENEQKNNNNQNKDPDDTHST